MGTRLSINACLDFVQKETRDREIKEMLRALQTLGLETGYILTRDRTEKIQAEGRTILVRPAWEFLIE